MLMSGVHLRTPGIIQRLVTGNGTRNTDIRIQMNQLLWKPRKTFHYQTLIRVISQHDRLTPEEIGQDHICFKYAELAIIFCMEN